MLPTMTVILKALTFASFSNAHEALCGHLTLKTVVSMDANKTWKPVHIAQIILTSYTFAQNVYATAPAIRQLRTIEVHREMTRQL